MADQLIIGFGTDMGNAEDAAMTCAEACQAAGFAVEARELNQIGVDELRAATHFLAVTSTFGDGEFPDNAALFWNALTAQNISLDHLNFAVLALGDIGYDLFCNAGRLLDERLEALGATRLTERIDIDGPYERAAAAWTTDVVTLIAAALAEPAAPAPGAEPAGRERHHPVATRCTVNRLLSGADSEREVRHYEIDLTGSGITYRAGDSLAVHATNDPALVDALLAQLGAQPDHVAAGHDEPLGTLLTEHLEIRVPSRALQDLVGARTRNASAAAALRTRAASWCYGKDVLDLVRLADLGVAEVVETLRPLQFRDYSIASSPLMYPDSVHLTVATVRYTCGDRRHGGVASTFLADRGENVTVQLRPNHSFRLPDPAVPIIMVGPGTGIAPFRGFLQERQATGASGPSWLFFGDRHRATHYLYGEELDAFARAGTLSRLDLAFSRDSETKTYVQHRMCERGADLFAWLRDGAHLYVCGDADRMARGVDAALREIVAVHGRLDAAAADAFVADLITSHRYVRDVY